MYMTQRKRIKYLNNADMLVEIHKSKMSFCSMHDVEHFEYDIITDDMRNITNEFLAEALEKRKKRLTATTLRVAQKTHNCTPKNAYQYVDQQLFDDIEAQTVSDVIIRIMTNEHIPLDEDENPIKPNFKPFKHYAMDSHGQLNEVVRSHWRGSIDNGEFSLRHGRLTEELGRMIEKLNEKIGMKSCYRGYTFLDEMKADGSFQLTKNALLFDESRITVQLNPFAYYTTIVEHAFKAVLNKEKRNRNIRDDLLQEYGFDPSNTRMAEIEQNMMKKAQERLASPIDTTADNGIDWGGPKNIKPDDSNETVILKSIFGDIVLGDE